MNTAPQTINFWHQRPGSILFLTGDFNVIGQYENSKVSNRTGRKVKVKVSKKVLLLLLQAIQYLTGKLEDSPVVFVDTFRKVELTVECIITHSFYLTKDWI